MRKMRLRVGAVLTVVCALIVAGASSASSDPSALEVSSLDTLTGPVMVELTGAPSAVVYADARKLGSSEAQAGNAAEARADANEAAKDRVLEAIASQDIAATKLFDVQTAYNGIAVQAEPGAAAELAALPGVKAVHAIPLVELDNHSSVPLIGGTTAWSSFGRTGAGLRIGVIDTGIDWTHTGFRGSGSAADLAIATSAAANPAAVPPTNDNPGGFTVMNGATQIYPNAKVVGGFDFAGDAYNGNNTPQPDPNPMDCNGHGSHVAGSAAGNGVNADGTGFMGSYATLTDPSSMRVGPGVAPQASIYGLRVFGCAGSTGLTVAAINWATDPNRDGNPADHLDVINMSLGSLYGTPDDPSAAASNNAAALGVQVVTSAGNSGDSFYVSGSPGSAVRAIATASSVDAAERADAIVGLAPASIVGNHIASRNVAYGWGNSTPTQPPSVAETTGNVYYPATNQFGCSPWTGADLANIAGRIVLVDWKIGTNPFPCGSAVRGLNAFNAGAAGIIMADSTTFLDTAISGDARIPGMYTNVNVGNLLKSVLTPGVVNPAVSVTLSSLVIGESTDNGRIDALSGFSSRGSRTRDNGLKPDIAAPGQTIWSVNSRSLNGGRSINGTSMASPHMAGVMALLQQDNPTWTNEELKALAMNTAGHDIFSQFGQTGPKFGVARVGSGRVDVAAALTSNSIALNDDGSGSVSVSFGAVEVAGTLTRTKTIRVHNRGSAAQTYTLSIDNRTSIPGVSYSFPDGTSLAVPAGSSGTFRVQLNANAAAMTNTHDPTVTETQTAVAAPLLNLPRQWVSEASGLVMVTPASGPALRVPVYAAARPSSNTAANLPFVDATGGDGTIGIEGAGVNTGAEPAGYQSKVSAFELGITSGLATLPAGVPEHARNADVKYAGAVRKGDWVYFGIATHGDWSTPATDVVFNIQLDRDGNGAAENPVIANNRLVFGPNADPIDVFVVTAPGIVSYTNAFDSTRTTAPYNNSVLVLPVPVAALGLVAGDTNFNYRVVAASRFFPTIDVTPFARYDIANQGIAFSDGLSTPATPISALAGPTTMFPDLQGTSIGVTYNAANFAANQSQGVLLLHHFGQGAQRTEVLPVVDKTYGLLALKGGACDNDALEMSGSGFAVTGNVHSNGGLKISGSKNTVSGTLTYRTGCRASVKGLTATATGLQADPLAHLTPAHFPCTFSRSGSWSLSGSLAPGVYCATGTIKVSGSRVSGDVTFVAPRVELSGSNLNLTPNRLGVVAWATGSGDAVKVSGSRTTFSGIVYAPNGQVELSGSGLTLGSIISSTMKLSGSGSTAQG
jgi:subtilisin family serine protease